MTIKHWRVDDPRFGFVFRSKNKHALGPGPYLEVTLFGHNFFIASKRIEW